MSSNVKFDKETLIKHRFWIALGIFAPLWLVAWLVLLLSVSGEVEKTKKGYDASMKSIDTVTNPKTAAFTTPLNEKKDKLEGRKKEVWVEVRGSQGNIDNDWPVNDKAPELGKLANEPFFTPVKGESEVRVVQQYRDVLYKEWRAA